MMQRRTKIVIGVGVGVGLSAIIIIAVTVPLVLLMTPKATPDTIPPSLVKCEDATFVSSTPLQPAYWPEPTFTDNVNITGNTSTIKQGTRLPYGRYNVTVKVWDAAKNEANCSYTLWVLAYNCDVKWLKEKIPDHVVLTCSINNPYFTCLTNCTQSEIYNLEPADGRTYECKATGKWGKIRAKCKRVKPKNGNPKCDDTMKTTNKDNHIKAMVVLESTFKVRTCVPEPCYYNSTNMFVLCGDTP